MSFNVVDRPMRPVWSLRDVMRRLVLWTAVAWGPLGSVPAWADDMPVPVEIQVPLLMKILSADRNLQDRVSGNLVIGILYQEKNRKSRATMAEFALIAASDKVAAAAKWPFTIAPIAIDQTEDLAGELARQQVNVCYVTPLQAVEVATLIAGVNTAGALTCTGVPDYVDRGAVVGIGTRGDRPEIIVNLDSARTAGAAFSSQLLKLARIVSGEAPK